MQFLQFVLEMRAYVGAVLPQIIDDCEGVLPMLGGRETPGTAELSGDLADFGIKCNPEARNTGSGGADQAMQAAADHKLCLTCNRPDIRQLLCYACRQAGIPHAFTFYLPGEFEVIVQGKGHNHAGQTCQRAGMTDQAGRGLGFRAEIIEGGQVVAAPGNIYEVLRRQAAALKAGQRWLIVKQNRIAGVLYFTVAGVDALAAGPCQALLIAQAEVVRPAQNDGSEQLAEPRGDWADTLVEQDHAAGGLYKAAQEPEVVQQAFETGAVLQNAAPGQNQGAIVAGAELQCCFLWNLGCDHGLQASSGGHALEQLLISHNHINAEIAVTQRLTLANQPVGQQSFIAEVSGSEVSKQQYLRHRGIVAQVRGWATIAGMRELRIVPGIIATLLLAACPQTDRSPGAGTAPPAGRYAEYASVLGRQADFEDELKRLQALYSTEPNPAAVSAGTAQLNYKLGTRVHPDGIAIVIRDNASRAEQVLWVWQDSAGSQSAPQLVDQQEQSGGMSMEYQLDNEIFLGISMRWVQDRYLEVKRTLTAGGLDLQFECSSGMTSWTLETARMPYRLLPAVNGPFGVVPDAQADDAWHGAAYPGELMLPALVAYDQSEGILLAIADEHPRRLDRSYACAWRMPEPAADAAAGADQLRIDYKIYDNTIDGWSSPILFSGLPLRDSVVLEPFSLAATDAEDSFVAGTTQQVAGRISEYTRAFQAIYPQRQAAEPYSILALDELGNDAAALSEILRLKSGLWNVRGLLLAGEAELPADCQALADEYGIVSWRKRAPFSLPGNSPQLAADPELRLLLPGKTDNSPVGLSLRRPATLDKLLSGFMESPAGLHYLLDPEIVEQGGQDQLRMQLTCSQQAAASLAMLKLCEENSLREESSQLAVHGLPSLACPPCTDQYFLPGGDGSSALQQRMLGMLAAEIFGVRAIPGESCSSPAALATSVTAVSAGMLVNESLLDFAGTDAMLTHSDSLFSDAGSAADYLLLHCEPRYGSYTLLGEAPGNPAILLLGLPKAWNGLSDIFIAVQRTTLDAYIDRDSQWLNLQTGDDTTTLQPMPFGMYEFEHPEPANVQDGDVLVIHRGLLPGGSSGEQG